MIQGDSPPECDGRNAIEPGAQRSSQDFKVQLVLSLILGVSALITFCVSVRVHRSLRQQITDCRYADNSSEMAVALLGTQAPPRPSCRPTQVDELVLRMDTAVVSNQREANTCGFGIGCFRGEWLLQSYRTSARSDH